MRMEQLKYLLEVVSSGSISAAAKQLYINQTTLSAAIQAVESELGNKLFQRTPKGIVLTPYGEQAMPKIRQILLQYEELLWLNRDNAAPPQRVHICISACACHFWGLYLTDALQKRGINTQVVIHGVAGNKVLPMIQDGKATLGLNGAFPHRLPVLKGQAEKLKMVVEPLYRDTTYVLLSGDSPLAKKAFITAEDLEEEHLALTDCCMERFYLSSFASHTSKISIFNSIETARSAVRENNMVCIMPRTAAQSHAIPGVVALPFQDEEALNTTITCLIHPRGGAMNPAEQTLVSIIKEWCLENQPPLGSPL